MKAAGWMLSIVLACSVACSGSRGKAGSDPGAPDLVQDADTAQPDAQADPAPVDLPDVQAPDAKDVGVDIPDLAEALTDPVVAEMVPEQGPDAQPTDIPEDPVPDTPTQDNPADTGSDPGQPDTPSDPGGPPSGCCMTPKDCESQTGPGSQCLVIGQGGSKWGVCGKAPEAGWCWTDADCGLDQVCHDPAVCPCEMDCDGIYFGPGLCVDKDASCVPIKLQWVKEWCDAADIVIWDGSQCVVTCPGCCGCHPFCDYTFKDIASCADKCLPGCTLWDGTCDDAIPDKPWWYFDGKKCQMEDSCIAYGAGVYATEDACKQACDQKVTTACWSHGECALDEVCLSLVEWPGHACGLCGKQDTCKCGKPTSPDVKTCATDQDCQGSGCGDGCDDCEPCPPCINGWCVYKTYEMVQCMCTGCG